MRAEEIVAAIQSGYLAVKVVFKSTKYPFEEEQSGWGEKQYTYKALESLNLIPGDLAIVESPKDGMVVVKVVQVGDEVNLDFSAISHFKWIVQKVDTTLYNTIRVQEADLLGKVKKILRQQSQQAVLQDFTAALTGHPNKDVIIESLQREADMPRVAESPALNDNSL